MGHLYDFITNANLPKALGLCERTVPEAFRWVCIEGVFMQIYQPLEPDDFQLIAQMKMKSTPDTVRPFGAGFHAPNTSAHVCGRAGPFLWRASCVAKVLKNFVVISRALSGS